MTVGQRDKQPIIIRTKTNATGYKITGGVGYGLILQTNVRISMWFTVFIFLLKHVPILHDF